MESQIFFPENQPTEEDILNNRSLQNQNINLANALNTTSFGNLGQSQNLIEFQLETNEYLAKLRHYLAGDIETIDKDGNRYFEVQKDDNLRILNNLGVNNYMGILSGFIGKETFLSVYGEERINELIGELGQLLRVETFSNAELYGLNTEYKITQFTILVYRTLVFIENAYRRSIAGKERELTRESRMVIQNQPLNTPQMGGMGIPTSLMPKQRFSLFKPKTW